MITVEEVRNRVAELAKIGEWSSDGHIEEDQIREDVLRAIAEGATNPGELAAAALLTAEYDFPRWYD